MKKVMLADDNERLLALLQATLENDERIQVLVGRNGKEILTTARRELPDLILLDGMMPEMDGYEVCLALKSDPTTAQIKVIMLTALMEESHRQRAQEVGVDEYITKPFSPTALLEKIDKMLALE